MKKKKTAPKARPASDKQPVGDAPDELAGLRQSIDNLDNDIIALLNRRATVAQQVGSIKAKNAQRAYAPERERQVVERLVARSSGPLSEANLRSIYKEIISASLALESPLRVAYLGPEATFTHEATKRQFGLSARLLPFRTIPEIFHEVECQRAEFGVVPIENSTEGIVDNTLDMFISTDLCICAEVLLQVSHHLLTRSGDLSRVKKVYCYPQALEACKSWLEANLPNVPVVDVPSMVRAAQLAVEDPSAAAVASDMATSLFELHVAASNLEDQSGNLSRFLVIGQDEPAPMGHDRTSIMFALKDEPGILYKALQPFATGNINMSRIESRPSRRRAWDYLFFIDLEGHRADPRVAAGIAALADTCVFMKVLGSYPAGKVDARRAQRRAGTEKEV